MQKLISELNRLYLVPGALAPEALERRFVGAPGGPLSLVSPRGEVRGMVLPFRKIPDGTEGQHWARLCELANALQGELGLPAPAVSISALDGYGLWLSLQRPVALERAQEFLEMLCAAYCPEVRHAMSTAALAVDLPPALDQVSGKWAAFIHPDLGAAFADEAGLEMAPPMAGQAALLEGLKSITPGQFSHAIEKLRPVQASVPPAEASSVPRSAARPGLLLADATLEDIIRHLHSKNIEPTFRHLIK